MTPRSIDIASLMTERDDGGKGSRNNVQDAPMESTKGFNNINEIFNNKNCTTMVR